MATQPQTFANHTRFFPLFHFVAVPLLVLNLLYSLYMLARAPSLATVDGALLAAGVVVAALVSRLMVLTVQNRVIRLEMTIRLERVLGAAAAADALASLPWRRLISLRFAPDAELPALIARVRSNELTSGRAVKQAIREWQPDYLRA